MTAVEPFASDVDGIPRRMRLVPGDVELPDAQREIDGIEIFERARQEDEVRREEQQQERDGRRSLRAHSIGWSFSASFKLPRR